jgi:hypothetical protein
LLDLLSNGDAGQQASADHRGEGHKPFHIIHISSVISWLQFHGWCLPLPPKPHRPQTADDGWSVRCTAIVIGKRRRASMGEFHHTAVWHKDN